MSDEKECTKICKKDQICNPQSGRCVARSGKIGKGLLTKIKSPKSVKSPHISRSKSRDGHRLAKPSLSSMKLVGFKKRAGPFDEIEGPVSLRHVYSGLYRKNIYIFGNERNTKCKSAAKLCLDMHEFIRNTILLNPDKVIDVFLEPNLESDDRDEGLSEISHLPNVRVACADKTYDDSSVLHTLVLTYQLYKEHMNGKNKTKINRLKKSLVGAEKIFPLNSNRIFRDVGISKQFSTIRDLYIEQVLQDYAIERVKTWKVTDKDLLAIRDGNNKNDMNISAFRIFMYIRIVTNMYLLSRFFSSYPEKDKGSRSEEVEFAFICTENDQIGNYMKIFRDLNFWDISAKTSDPRTSLCLNISDIEQPFFREVPRSQASYESEKTVIKVASAKLIKWIPAKYKIVGQIGAGLYGHAFLLSDPDFNQQVLKIQFIDDAKYGSSRKAFEHEYKLQAKFAAVGIAPTPRKMRFFDRSSGENTSYVGAILMDRVYGTIGKLMERHVFSPGEIDHLVSEIERVLKIMCKEGLIHGDFHMWNLGYNLGKTPGKFRVEIIDFGYSCCIKHREQCQVKFELSKILDVNSIPGAHDWKTPTFRKNMLLFVPAIKELMGKFGIKESEISERNYEIQHRNYINNIYKPDL
jgi:hypothetical protein